jgi:hypothetical protein
MATSRRYRITTVYIHHDQHSLLVDGGDMASEIRQALDKHLYPQGVPAGVKRARRGRRDGSQAQK